MTAPTNPIATQSRARLVRALLDLMLEVPYADITITQIADRSGLSRRTFYRNFTQKSDLLAEHVSTLTEEYIVRLRAVADRPMPDIVIMHFTFWTEHLGFLRTLHRSGMLWLVLEAYNQQMQHVSAATGSTRFAQVPRQDYALAFNAGGYFNLMVQWLRGGARETPQEMAAAIRGMAW